jgi:hypothetical protein
MNILLPESAQQTYESPSAFGAIRVDEMPIHNINFNISLQKGNRFAIATFTNFENEGSIINELARGNSLRIKLAPCGRTIRLVRRTPWYPHYIRDIPPWA